MPRCKMRCIRTGQRPGWRNPGEKIHDAEFSAVTDGSSENAEFFAATPAGKLELGVLNEQHFEVGKEYYIDITPTTEITTPETIGQAAQG